MHFKVIKRNVWKGLPIKVIITYYVIIKLPKFKIGVVVGLSSLRMYVPDHMGIQTVRVPSGPFSMYMYSHKVLFSNCIGFDKTRAGIKFGMILYLRNRFLLTLICCPIYHWLEVSREVDISRARSASDIFTVD